MNCFAPKAARLAYKKFERDQASKAEIVDALARVGYALQSIAPITLTREVRRGQPLAIDWDRKPKILFAFASPRGFAPVPAQTHLEAMRRAIEPWVKWRATPEQRINEVKSVLTVLPNVSLQQLRKACAESDFTHVHILAHGDKIGRDDDRRYGIALCADDNGVEKDMVDGDALATALTAKDSLGGRRWSVSRLVIRVIKAR